MTSDEPRPSERSLVAGTVVLLSAFLLFVLELVTARALLPRFGGSPMVWTTSMLVYQVLLLVGYAYAHGLARQRSGRLQAVVHVVLLAVGVGIAYARLRTGALGGGDPAAMSRHPALDLVWTMLVTIAIPFIVVAATSPLVQHWQACRYPNRSAYWLYAVSNIGSFGGLLVYLVVIEPLLTVERQFMLWRLTFMVVAVALAALAIRARRFVSLAPAMPAQADVTEGLRPVRYQVLLWIIVPAGTSAMLLAATNELCLDLAVFPFLWVLPLSLYLLSFSLAFRSRAQPNGLPVGAIVTLVALVTTALSIALPAPLHMASISALLFGLCLAAHRELYRLRPAASRLTAYYLSIAAGSGVGGAVVAWLAPTCFVGYWEFQIAILVVWLGLVAATALDPQGCMRRGDTRQAGVLLGVVSYLLLTHLPERWIEVCLKVWPWGGSVAFRMSAAVVLSLLLWWGGLRRRRAAQWSIWPRVLAGVVIFYVECSMVERVRGDRSQSGRVTRNFFGVVRVQEVRHSATGIQLRQLTHGRINHGWQYVNPNLKGEPTSYHSPSTGIGRLLRLLQSQRERIRIGVTGLGAGALAAYPRAADQIVFYEIDPQVVALSVGPGAVFSFLSDCPGRTDIVLGDARQSLQAEQYRQGSRRYDVLVLDAFSSDAIPMHLLTREAISLYLAHLVQPGGVLAVNISNRFLDIEPVLADMAARFDLHALLIDSMGDSPVRARSLWVLLTRDPVILAAPELAEVGRPLGEKKITWTDSYGSPFQLLKWWNPQSRGLRMIPPRRAPKAATAPALLPEQTSVRRAE
ncbi:MAG: fused MFS/spermidine synthase [Lentisphaerae bacterium]|nr:fused MFS/spermidine synthase [Lentisphaerota bacterium]